MSEEIIKEIILIKNLLKHLENVDSKSPNVEDIVDAERRLSNVRIDLECIVF